MAKKKKKKEEYATVSEDTPEEVSENVEASEQPEEGAPVEEAVVTDMPEVPEISEVPAVPAEEYLIEREVLINGRKLVEVTDIRTGCTYHKTDRHGNLVIL